MVVLAAMSLPLLKSEPTKVFATVDLFDTDHWVYWPTISEERLWLCNIQIFALFYVFLCYVPVFFNGKLNARTLEDKAILFCHMITPCKPYFKYNTELLAVLRHALFTLTTLLRVF